MIFTCDSL